MEKKLRLYKIPDVDEIISVSSFSVDFDFPQNATEGDLVVNYDETYGYRLFEYKEIYGELDWIDIQQDQNKYYCAKQDGEPLFFNTSDGGDLQPYDVSFPQGGRVAEVYDFTYSARRMGNAPTISGTLMFRECLDEMWTDRVCVYFNKKFYFIDKIPASEYNNSDERYKHSLEFVSENVLLENVYFTNVVDIENYEDDITRLPMQWLEFSFFGGIDEFISRLNLSLAYSGLDAQHVGFRVVKDTLPPIEEKLISISETTLKAALDLIYETWEIPYWFDGYTIHVGYSNKQQMEQAGITMPVFRYGAVQSLLSLQKSQSNDIVNRITGLGSSENIPVFYPNKNPNAIEIQYERNQTLMINYARVANPYKTVKIVPSTHVGQNVPDGTFFKFMPITKTYNYDQFVTINPHTTHAIANADDPVSGGALLVSSEIPNYNIRMRYFTQDILSVSAFESGATEAFAVKYAWVWLQDGVFQNLTFVDDWKGLFANYTKGYVKVKSFNITHDQFEHNSVYTTSFNEGQTSDIINLTYTPTNIPHTNVQWSDGVTADSYESRMPFDINSIPQGTTCLLFMFVRRYQKYIYDDDVEIFLKNTTRFVATHRVLSSPDWSLNADGHATQLWRYGLRLNAGVTPQENDLIYFTREAGALPFFGRLLPYSFRQTNDIWLNAKNNEYLKENGQDYYSFENLYKISCAKEHVEDFEDIKPTIKGMSNNETPAKRIDQILDVAFDQDDNNDLDESGEKYQHPYFFVKLAKTSLDDGFGFNLFDCAIEGNTMQLNMSDGNCGGCTFDVMVKYQSDGLSYNPVGLFEQDTTINGVTYEAGTPLRDAHGNIVLNRKEDLQQDTSAAEVWIALKKDNETFGNYDNGAEVVYPDSAKGDNFIPSAGDGFTIINICLPYAYIVAAETRLYHALLDFMEKSNPRTWSFSVKFSSIYYKKHYEFMDRWLNESSRVPFVYNGIQREYYVQSYTYKMGGQSALPEVSVELGEQAKKIKTYYAVKYNPYEIFETVDSQHSQQKTIKKMVEDHFGQMEAQDSETNNLHVHGDITLSDGTSLNSQILALNSQVFANEKSLTAENIWSKVKGGADSLNSFVDGIFATDLNTTTAEDVRITHIQDGAVGDNCLHAVFAENGSTFSFDQKIPVVETKNYTAAFFAKASAQDDIVVDVTFYDEQDSEVGSVKKTIGVGVGWEQFVVPFYTDADSEYATLSFSYFGEGSGVGVDFDGVAVYPEDFTTQDQDGETVASSLLPVQYKMSPKDIFNAIDKLGGGGSSSDEVLVCTFTSTSSTKGIIDKTAAEILQAANDGKSVICVFGNEIYYLVSKNVLTFSRILQRSSKYITYDQTNDNWVIVTISLQQQLTSGSTIKTINNESLLGSGDISVGDNVFVCKYNSTNNTVDKTFQEIAAARNAGKVVICKLSNIVYYLVSLSETSNIICFAQIADSTWPPTLKYIKFSNNAWTSHIINIQEKLTSGTNIKTINGNSVLGSGNLDITTPLYDNGTRIMIDSDGLHTVDLTDHSVTIINFAVGVTTVRINFTLNTVGDREVVLKRADGGAGVTFSVNEFSTSLSTKRLSLHSSASINSDSPRTFTVRCRKIEPDVYFFESSSISIYSSYGSSNGATWTPPSE